MAEDNAHHLRLWPMAATQPSFSCLKKEGAVGSAADIAIMIVLQPIGRMRCGRHT